MGNHAHWMLDLITDCFAGDAGDQIVKFTWSGFKALTGFAFLFHIALP